MTNHLDHDIGVAMASFYDADGFKGIQVDGYGESASGIAPYEHHAVYGFDSRPLDPDVDAEGNAVAGCAVVYALEGGRGHAWLGSDPRVVPKMPPLKKGGSSQYGATGSFHVIDGEDGSHTIYVPYAFAGGVATKAHLLELGVGNEAIQINHADGASITLLSDKAIVSGPDGTAYIELGNGTVTVVGTLKIVGGLDVNGGAIPGVQSNPIVVMDPTHGPSPSQTAKAV